MERQYLAFSRCGSLREHLRDSHAVSQQLDKAELAMGDLVNAFGYPFAFSRRRTALLATYKDTVLRFPAGLDIDLRDSLGPTRRAALARVVPWQTFAVITAANPGRLLEAEENAKRREALAEALRRQDANTILVLGCSPDGEHCEESFCADLPKAVAIEVAREFEQDAIFWYDGAVFWLLGARRPIGEVRLPPDSTMS